VYSDKVGKECWSNNPCQYNRNVLPAACQDKSGRCECMLLVLRLPPYLSLLALHWRERAWLVASDLQQSGGPVLQAATWAAHYPAPSCVQSLLI